MDEDNKLFYVEQFEMHLHPNQIVGLKSHPLKGKFVQSSRPRHLPFADKTPRPASRRDYYTSILGLPEASYRAYTATLARLFWAGHLDRASSSGGDYLHSPEPLGQPPAIHSKAGCHECLCHLEESLRGAIAFCGRDRIVDIILHGHERSHGIRVIGQHNA